jgi:endogenous inhibitor of DNA gyrase (YacG/DUF329 family)
MESPDDANHKQTRSRQFRCPTCKRIIKPSQEDYSERVRFYPFCSERCRLIDLGAWLDADYRIPSRPDEESEKPPPGDATTHDGLSQ